MDDCIVFDGVLRYAPDALHKRMLERIVDMDILANETVDRLTARIAELEGNLSEAMNFAMEQQGSIVMLEAENAALRAALPVPTGLRQVADMCWVMMQEEVEA